MINNNKILTVSYGTFSCTLEGFDDSFGTMKAIAEYFRDLSADDRYFGAEPVQPDAQMLARIAQREISRHVDAREDDGRIVLTTRQLAVQDSAAEDAVMEDAPAPERETAPIAKKSDAPVAQPEAPQTAAAPSADPAPADDLAAEGDVAFEVETAPDASTATDARSADIVPSLPDADVEAFFAEAPAAPAPRAAPQEAPVAAQAKADSIAEKLKRIRAVVSQQSDSTADTPDYSEDQHAEASMSRAAPELDADADADSGTDDEGQAPENNVLEATLRDLEDALDADDAAIANAVSDPDDASEEDDIAAILNRLERESGTVEEATDARSMPQEEAEDDDLHDVLDSLVAGDDGDELDDPEDDNLFDAQASAAPAPAKPAAPRTRVLKVKRATLDAAIRAGKLEEYDDTEEEHEAGAPAPLRKAPLAGNSSLTDEDEDALARELAELEADIQAAKQDAPEPEPDMAEDDGFDDEDEFEDAYDDDAYADTQEGSDTRAPAEAGQLRAELKGDADDDLTRLMQETDSQMDEPEGATRRDAFAHLRAAVAAKKADEAAGGGTEPQDSGEAYRDDLASVVRPRRPVPAERSRTERPAEQRPAPLKLVAEQRIDSGAPSAAPVRPRRVAAVVSAAAPNADTTAASFADFAADVGAQKLPDLLEAAAAYLSFVEGHEEFSRPQLMNKVRLVEKENFTREDSLRSFGKLLREGKIHKLKGGRFQASEQIAFRPEARAAS